MSINIWAHLCLFTLLATIQLPLILLLCYQGELICFPVRPLLLSAMLPTYNLLCEIQYTTKIGVE